MKKTIIQTNKRADWEETWKTLVLKIFLDMPKNQKGRYPLGQLEAKGIDFIRSELAVAKEEGIKEEREHLKDWIKENYIFDEVSNNRKVIVVEDLLGFLK